MNNIFTFFSLLILVNTGLARAGDMVLIPAGTYTVGIDLTDSGDLKNKDSNQGPVQGIYIADSTPARSITTKGFYIDKFEVSNADYLRYCRENKHPYPPHWKNGPPKSREANPVVQVTWFNANSYCKWAGKRLPTEDEWEIAARGPQAFTYPWGNTFDTEKANLDRGKSLPAGSVITDKSPFGVFDMAGNVTEWTASWYTRKPGNKVPSELYGKKFRVLRGGEGISTKQHYKTSGVLFSLYVRNFSLPASRGFDAGFRCVSEKEMSLSVKLK